MPFSRTTHVVYVVGILPLCFFLFYFIFILFYVLHLLGVQVMAIDGASKPMGLVELFKQAHQGNCRTPDPLPQASTPTMVTLKSLITPWLLSNNIEACCCRGRGVQYNTVLMSKAPLLVPSCEIVHLVLGFCSSLVALHLYSARHTGREIPIAVAVVYSHPAYNVVMWLLHSEM